jgi:DNA-directed RNA polymerase specialized sigma54-like protein
LLDRIPRLVQEYPGLRIAGASPVAASAPAADVLVDIAVGDPVLQVRLNQDGRPRLEIVETSDAMAVDDARFVLQALANRDDLLLRVAQAIVRREERFFRAGGEADRQMIERDIGEDLGCDQSTVRRIATGKRIACGHGVYPLDDFFFRGALADASVEDGDVVIPGDHGRVRRVELRSIKPKR